MLRWFLETVFQKPYEEIVIPTSTSSVIFYGIMAYIFSFLFTSLLVPLIGPYTDL